MAVVQISRIQIRRGQKNSGTGIPQLASGELAWAIDTQELFIGNGSVAEGAPYVGNSKILTTNDNILELFEQYQYKKNDPTIQTGADSNYPVLRSVQDRLDERVSVAAFGVIGGSGTTDDTVAIQRVINQLYLNPATTGLVTNRYVLEFGPGIYTFSNTIYIPSYTSIQGSGQGRTVFVYNGTGSAFEFVNDTSTIGNPSTINSTTFGNQPKHTYLSGFSLNLTNTDVTGFKLNAVRNSIFEDIGVNGNWTNTDPINSNSMAYGMYALSAAVTTSNNSFFRINASGHTYGVYAKQDINGNVFNSCTFNDMHMGVSFGQGANLSSQGEQFGPRNNSVTDCTFEDINRQGIKVESGSGNISSSNRFVNVGNDAGGSTNAQYGHIEFDSIGNSSVQDIFDRAIDLASGNYTSAYVGEVVGQTLFTNVTTRKIGIVETSNFIELFRLPLSNKIGYEVTYIYQSSNGSRMRSGKLLIAADLANNKVQLVDEYEFAGTSGEDTNLEFKATLVDSNSSSVLDSILITYKNLSSGDLATLSYSYRALS
jgi:hypothetical protein